MVGVCCLLHWQVHGEEELPVRLASLGFAQDVAQAGLSSVGVIGSVWGIAGGVLADERRGTRAANTVRDGIRSALLGRSTTGWNEPERVLDAGMRPLSSSAVASGGNFLGASFARAAEREPRSL